MSEAVALAAPGDVGGAQSIGRALQLMRQVGSLGEAGLSALTAQSGLSRPTVRRILLALIEAGFVEQDPQTRRYRLGIEAAILGQMAQSRLGLHDLAIDGLYHLAQTSEDATFLSLRLGLGTLCVHREEGRYPIRTHVLKPGDRHPLAVGAGGLAILSGLTPDEVELALAANAPILAEAYPTLTVADTRDRVDLARRTGWSLNPGLVFAGSWGIAVPVRDPRGRPVAALTLAAIESRLQPDRQAELGPLLRDEAGRLEALLARVETWTHDPATSDRTTRRTGS